MVSEGNEVVAATGISSLSVAPEVGFWLVPIMEFSIRTWWRIASAFCTVFVVCGTVPLCNSRVNAGSEKAFDLPKGDPRRRPLSVRLKVAFPRRGANLVTRHGAYERRL